MNGQITRVALLGVFLFAAALYMPIIGVAASFFIPLIFVYFRTLMGRKLGAVLLVATMLVLIPVVGGVGFNLFYFFEYALLGFFLGEFLEWGLSIEKTLGFAVVGTIVTGVLIMLMYSASKDASLWDLTLQYLTANLELTIALYRKLGVPAENIRPIIDSKEVIVRTFLFVIPSIWCVVAIVAAWINILAGRKLLVANGFYFPDFGPLNRWKAPDKLIWMLIVSGVMLAIPVTAFKFTGLNGVIVILTIYFIQGIAIVSFFFEKKGFPIMLRVFFYLMLLNHAVLFLVIGLGLFDLWANFRKLDVEV